MISSEDSEKSIRRAYEMGVSDYISRPFDGKVVYQRVFNTIKLYAKQRRLITLVTDQVYEKEKNNRIMVSILSQIVEFEMVKVDCMWNISTNCPVCSWNGWYKKPTSII